MWTLLRVLAALALTGAPACTRGAAAKVAETSSESGAVVTAPDSLRGLLDIVGSEPGTWAVIRGHDGARDVTLQGDRAMFARLAGLDVAVWGATLRPGVFRVDRLAVRAANGIAAVDGTLARDGTRWVLVAHDGRRIPIAQLPESLRGSAGARVWLAGPLDRAPDASGIVSDRP